MLRKSCVYLLGAMCALAIVAGSIALMELTRPEPPTIRAEAVAAKFRTYRSQMTESYVISAIEHNGKANVAFLSKGTDLDNLHPAVQNEVERLADGRPYHLNVKDRLYGRPVTAWLSIYAKHKS